MSSERTFRQEMALKVAELGATATIGLAALYWMYDIAIKLIEHGAA